MRVLFFILFFKFIFAIFVFKLRLDSLTKGVVFEAKKFESEF